MRNSTLTLGNVTIKSSRDDPNTAITIESTYSQIEPALSKEAAIRRAHALLIERLEHFESEAAYFGINLSYKDKDDYLDGGSF